MDGLDECKNRLAVSRRRVPRKKDFQNNFKTEMCIKWESGGCPYGDKCAFAHGIGELKLKSNISRNYRTKACRSFFEKGFCAYGMRCQFSHQISKRTAPSTPNKSRDTSEENQCVKPRLPVFVRLETLNQGVFKT